MKTRSPITSHVLDLRIGKPAALVAVKLEHKDGGSWREIGRGSTNSDGRVENLLTAEHSLREGSYRLSFEVKSYFQTQQVAAFYPEVVVTFEVGDTKQHYHVPVLLSPYGYSTYRGS